MKSIFIPCIISKSKLRKDDAVNNISPGCGCNGIP